MSIATLPAYDASQAQGSSHKDEKADTFCPNHGPSTTPQIDSIIQQSSMQNHLLTLSKTLADLAEDGCTKCATESILRISTSVMTDLHKQKKSGTFTKEQKKALKQEGKQFKAFIKPLKKEMKESFRSEK